MGYPRGVTSLEEWCDFIFELIHDKLNMNGNICVCMIHTLINDFPVEEQKKIVAGLIWSIFIDEWLYDILIEGGVSFNLKTPNITFHRENYEKGVEPITVGNNPEFRRVIEQIYEEISAELASMREWCTTYFFKEYDRDYEENMFDPITVHYSPGFHLKMKQIYEEIYAKFPFPKIRDHFSGRPLHPYYIYTEHFMSNEHSDALPDEDYLLQLKENYWRPISEWLTERGDGFDKLRDCFVAAFKLEEDDIVRGMPPYYAGTVHNPVSVLFRDDVVDFKASKVYRPRPHPEPPNADTPPTRPRDREAECLLREERYIELFLPEIYGIRLSCPFGTIPAPRPSSKLIPGIIREIFGPEILGYWLNFSKSVEEDAVADEGAQRCPSCHESIMPEAVRCCYCGASLAAYGAL